MKYRKKPVVIEAVKWTGDNLDEIKSFIGEDSHFHTVSSKMVTSTGRIETEEQLLGSDKLSRLAHIGDYIIKYSDGEYGTCKPDIFEKTYEPIIKSKWLNEDMQTDTISCFVCGFQLPDAELATPYCPNCGAKMDV